MAYDYAPFVRKVFEDTGPNNPLRKLSDEKKHVLVALVHVYLMERLLALNTGNADALDEIGTIAAEASDLANRMRTLVFGGSLAEPLSSLVGKFRGLPSILEAFASQTSWLVNQTGKPGHKEKLWRSHYLIVGSEFIHGVAGNYFDEHFAEVIQTVAFRCNPSSEAGDLSGDAIRKKREHIKKTYPAMFAHYHNEARDMVLKTSPNAPGPSESRV
jgi:hypothetical protein